MASGTRVTIQRIHRELADLEKERGAGNLGGIALGPRDIASGDLFTWKASLPGPEGSPYEGGTFDVEIIIPPDYPFSAPRVRFETMIYHMNISERGAVCLDILKHAWSPALSLFKLVLSLSSLLTDPNPKDPLVPSIATEYTRKRAQHDETARIWTRIYAIPAMKAQSSVTYLAPSTSTRPATSRNALASSTASTDHEAVASSTRTGVPTSAAAGRQGKRRRIDGRPPLASTNSADVLDLTDDSAWDDNSTSSHSFKRKKPGTRGDSRPNGGTSTSKANDDNVIVIED